MEFHDKVVIITGASSGIGAATALHLARQSAKLALVGRNKKNLKAIALYCSTKAKGILPLTIAADLTDDNEVETVIKETIDHFGRLDILINNAGIVVMGGLKNSNMEAYDKVMATNMRSVYHLTMLATPHLIESKGCVVNVSSIASNMPSTTATAYHVSKAAIDHFTKCAALELAPDGVRVNSVNPGFVKTNLLKNVGLTQDQLDLLSQNMVGRTPMKKIIEGEDIASLIAFLASDKAKSITGCNYTIDAGRLLNS